MLLHLYALFQIKKLNSALNLQGARLIDLPQFAFLFPMILYIASVIENRPILIYLGTVVVHSKLISYRVERTLNRLTI